MKRMWIYGFAALRVACVCGAYELAQEYAGNTFFDEWNFYGSWDNLTNGDVWWLDRQNATNQRLAYVNSASHAIIRVDNTTNVPLNEKRNSVRITTQASYGVGSLWIADILHIPYGCSVWPAFWSKGPLWPDDGEIDILEGINQMTTNQMALHTTPGCNHTTPPNQLGQSEGLGPGNTGGTGLNADGQIANDCSTPSGCIVTETKNASYGAAFARNGGGVWATQFDVAGIFIWFFQRSQIPASITSAASDPSATGIDLADWGNPSASYPRDNCTIEDYFDAQQLVLDITLCGDWAGLPAVYNQTCANTGPTGICYNDNVVGSGANYANAYFEISYLHAYTTSAAAPIPTNTSSHSTSGGSGNVTPNQETGGRQSQSSGAKANTTGRLEEAWIIALACLSVLVSVGVEVISLLFV